MNIRCEPIPRSIASGVASTITGNSCYHASRGFHETLLQGGLKLHRIGIVITTVFLSIFTADARVFFTGSNPVLSSIVFPQDNLIIPGGDNISFYTSWQNFPWWGDLDEPENKPNNQYIFSGQRTTEQQYKGAIDQLDNTVSVSRWLTERKKLRFDLTYSSRNMHVEANGENEGVAYSYEERGAIRELYLTSVLATYYKEIPVGLRVGIGGVVTSKPQLQHLLLDGGQVEESNEIFWGWNGDNSPRQEQFATGSPLKFDLQGAATFPRHKIGFRCRYYAGNLDSYNWDTDHYDIEEMRIHNYTFRLYGIYNWYKRERFRFNTTALTRFTVLDTVGVPSDDANIQGAKARAKVFVFQVNPNVNIFPWKYPMTYIDAAILCNYQYTRYDYLRGGGYVWTGIPWNIEDVSGENFSYGNENFLEAALDIYASIPVFGMKNQMVALGVSTLVWRRYKWFNKYYGHMDNNEFAMAGVRRNFDKEMWLNTVINLVYKRGKVMYRLDFGQPLIYSLEPRTTLYDADDKIIAGRSKEKMWLAQSGYKVGFFVSTDLENFMRYQPLARPER